jgi:cytochrome b561
LSRAVASRHHPALVALHWLVALMILGLIGLGYFVLAPMPNTDPGKLQILVWHMSGGMAVLALMIVRVIVRARSARPGPGSPHAPMLDRLAGLAHFGLYLVVFAMIVSGWLTGYLISGAFAGKGQTLPARFSDLPTFQVHAALAALLTALIVVHVAAALYHQFVLKDALFQRIGFGRRTVAVEDGRA